MIWVISRWSAKHQGIYRRHFSDKTYKYHLMFWLQCLMPMLESKPLSSICLSMDRFKILNSHMWGWLLFKKKVSFLFFYQMLLGTIASCNWFLWALFCMVLDSIGRFINYFKNIYKDDLFPILIDGGMPSHPFTIYWRNCNEMKCKL